MIKKILLIFIYCFFINGLFAQPNLEWYDNYEQPIHNGNSWQFDGEKNLYFVGTFEKGFDFDINSSNEYYYINPTTKQQEHSFGIAKYNTNGELLWVKALPNDRNHLLYPLYVKIEGNTIYIINKLFQDRVGAPNFNKPDYKIYSDDYQSVFVSQYDLNGRFKRIDNVLFIENGGLDHIFVEKFIIDKEGNFHISGNFKGSINFDGKNRSNNYHVDYQETAFYVKYSKSFKVLQHFVLDSDTAAWMLEFDLDKNNNIYLTGQFKGTLNLDPIKKKYTVKSDYLFPSVPDVSGFIVKIDKDGNYVWGKKTDFNDARGMLIDTKDNLYIGAAFLGEKNLNINGKEMLYESPKYQNGHSFLSFIGKYDLNGNLKWIKTIQNGGIGKFYYKEGMKYATVGGTNKIVLENGDELDFIPGNSQQGIINTQQGIIMFNDKELKKLHIARSEAKTSFYGLDQKGNYIVTSGIYNDGVGENGARAYINEMEIPEYNVLFKKDENKQVEGFVILVSNAEINEDEIEQPGTGTAPNLRFAIYPNPSNGQFIIEVDGYLFGTTYKIYDESGRKIYEDKIIQQKNEVSINVAAGVYAISFYRNDEIIKSHKIIVKQ